jgi:hypothetical protein
VPTYSNQPPTMLSHLCDCPTIGADYSTVGHRLWSDLLVATSYRQPIIAESEGIIDQRMPQMTDALCAGEVRPVL